MSSEKDNIREVLITRHTNSRLTLRTKALRTRGLRDTDVVKAARYRVSMPPCRDGGRVSILTKRGRAAHAFAKQY